MMSCLCRGTEDDFEQSTYLGLSSLICQVSWVDVINFNIPELTF